MIIYSISGKAESGKNLVGTIIKEVYEKRGMKVCELLFAKRIKQYAKEYFGWDGREETKPREILQKIGTDIIRNKLNIPDFHVNSVIQDIEILKEFFDVFILTDLRFFNECDLIKDRFNDEVVSIRVNRPNHISKLTQEQLNHSSETALDNKTDWDYMIHNDSTIENLKLKIMEVIK